MTQPFHDFDLTSFWSDDAYDRKTYEDKPLTDAMVSAVEADLGVRLPASYIALMRSRNGGCPKNTRFRTSTRTSWAQDHVAISGLSAIGRRSHYALCGAIGARFMREEWGYPDWAIAIADCPSAGHDLVVLDYATLGATGEPRVVHVDQEDDYKVTFLADDFESFARGLIHESAFADDTLDNPEGTLEEARLTVTRGAFSPSLAATMVGERGARAGALLRRLALAVVEEKGAFFLHDDLASHRVYDLVFHLASTRTRIDSKEVYVRENYTELIALAEGFSPGGYVYGHVMGWLNARRKVRAIVTARTGELRFSAKAAKRLEAEIAAEPLSEVRG